LKTYLSPRLLSLCIGLSLLASGAVLAQNSSANIIWGTTEKPANSGAAKLFQTAPAKAAPAKAAPAPAQPPSGNNPAVNAVKKNIALHEGRAAALQPVVARDIGARDSIVADAAALDGTARDDRTQAADYRTLAAVAPDAKTRTESLAFATKLETFARQSDDSAKIHRDTALRLDKTIKAMQAEVAFHLERAATLKTWLASNS
jgi:hypothetical protein